MSLAFFYKQTEINFITSCYPGVGQPFVNYPQLDFQPACFFALGSPIGMFLTIRGVGRVGENYRLPTCPFMFNVFHPVSPYVFLFS